MKHRSILSSLAVVVPLLCTSTPYAAGNSGIVRFTGMIVEPPCAFDVDAASRAKVLRPSCPRPAAGKVEFIDAITQQPIHAMSFTHASPPIDLPKRRHDDRAEIVAVISYR